MPLINKKEPIRSVRSFGPGSAVGEISSTTCIIKEPNNPEVRVHNSDFAKFGTKNERETELAD